MGVLKHFVLPVLAVAHAFQAYKILLVGKDEIPRLYGWPHGSDPLTPREEHMMGVILAMSLTLFVNCVAGVFLENAHYRGMATVLEFIFFGAQLWDAQLTGFPTNIKIIYTVVAGSGLLVHSMEPGIFTKDKIDKTKKKSS